MVLQIKLGVKKEKRLRKHLMKEHPSTRGNMKIKTSKGKRIKFKRNINSAIKRIKKSVPDFESQARDMTEL
jgi:hypothetical protein